MQQALIIPLLGRSALGRAVTRCTTLGLPALKREHLILRALIAINHLEFCAHQFVEHNGQSRIATARTWRCQNDLALERISKGHRCLSISEKRINILGHAPQIIDLTRIKIDLCVAQQRIDIIISLQCADIGSIPRSKILQFCGNQKTTRARLVTNDNSGITRDIFTKKRRNPTRQLI